MDDTRKNSTNVVERRTTANDSDDLPGGVVEVLIDQAGRRRDPADRQRVLADTLQAEQEGLDRIFIAAGLTWGESGCSMCLGINGDTVPPGERCASTTNRNFRGRQGPGARTHLMSPAMVAAAAVHGHLADVRPLLAGRKA